MDVNHVVYKHIYGNIMIHPMNTLIMKSLLLF